MPGFTPDQHHQIGLALFILGVWSNGLISRVHEGGDIADDGVTRIWCVPLEGDTGGVCHNAFGLINIDPHYTGDTCRMIALHEIMHNLGVTHIEGRPSVMQAELGSLAGLPTEEDKQLVRVITAKQWWQI